MVAREKINSTVQIPLEQLTFHPHSFADDAGRLFSWNGELYRGITASQAPFYSRLLREGVLETMIEHGLLIETEPADLIVDGYATVVRHATVPFVSYPNEWPAPMLKDAALAMIDLALQLARKGLILKDAHPWNMLFRTTRPVFVDLTSIAPLRNESDWRAYDEFCRFCYYPLILMAHGLDRIARSLLPEYRGVLRTELLTILRGSGLTGFALSKLFGRVSRSLRSVFARKKVGRESVLAFLKQVRQDLEKIQLRPGKESNDEKSSGFGGSRAARFDRTSRRQALEELLTELQPLSVLDLSAGSHWSSILPATMGFNVVSIGTEARAAAIYQTARKQNLPILSLVVDFIKPTPSIGYSNHYSVAANERLKCEMVLALGFVNRIASENHFNFELISEGLSSFSKRWLVVDFAELDNGDGGTRGDRSLDRLIGELGKQFSCVRVVSSNPQTGVLLLCEK